MVHRNKLTKKKNLVLPFIGDKHYVLLTFHGEKKFQRKQWTEAVLNSRSYRAVPGPMQTSARTHRAQEHNIKSNTVIYKHR